MFIRVERTVLHMFFPVALLFGVNGRKQMTILAIMRRGLKKIMAPRVKSVLFHPCLVMIWGSFVAIKTLWQNQWPISSRYSKVARFGSCWVSKFCEHVMAVESGRMGAGVLWLGLLIRILAEGVIQPQHRAYIFSEHISLTLMGDATNTKYMFPFCFFWNRLGSFAIFCHPVVDSARKQNLKDLVFLQRKKSQNSHANHGPHDAHTLSSRVSLLICQRLLWQMNFLVKFLVPWDSKKKVSK